MHELNADNPLQRRHHLGRNSSYFLSVSFFSDRQFVYHTRVQSVTPMPLHFVQQQIHRLLLDAQTLNVSHPFDAYALLFIIQYFPRVLNHGTNLQTPHSLREPHLASIR